jgi:hypothetical protein
MRSSPHITPGGWHAYDERDSLQARDDGPFTVMLSLKGSRSRIPIALVAACLMGATLPGTICTIACLTHDAAGFHEDHAAMAGMDPCHAGYSVTAAQPHANLDLEAIPASGRVALGARISPAVSLAFRFVSVTAVADIATPPPRIG